MKRFLCFLLLPLVSLIFLCGCGDDKNSKDLQILYESMVNTFIVEKENKLFSDSERPNTLSIKYTDEVEDAINNDTPSTDIQKRYRAIEYQQRLLNYIFNYYENNQEEFYKVMSSKDYSNTDMNDLYNSLSNLKSKVSDFKQAYNLFIDATKSGISDIMEFNLTNYSYELNKIIEESFTFMYKFAYMYETYGIEDYSNNSVANLKIKVDKSYLDIAYVIYLQNFKAFNYSVGNKGICDLVSVVGNEKEFNLTNNLNTTKSLSIEVLSNLKPDDEKYEEVNNLINDFIYSKEVFDQRIKNYKNIYNDQDVYTITQYKFDLINGVDYSSYINNLNSSDKASIAMLDGFISTTYQKLVDKLSLIVE